MLIHTLIIYFLFYHYYSSVHEFMDDYIALSFYVEFKCVVGLSDTKTCYVAMVSRNTKP